MFHRSRFVSSLCCAALLIGCGGGGDSPTAPQAPATTTLVLDFTNVQVIDDCDGIEGDGDFDFFVSAYPSWGSQDVVYAQRVINLGPGGTSRLIGRHTYTTSADTGATVLVSFRASELDNSILGVPFNDDRLDDAYKTFTHRYEGGAWSGLGPQSISLGSTGCLVRLYWTAEVAR